MPAGERELIQRLRRGLGLHRSSVDIDHILVLSEAWRSGAGSVAVSPIREGDRAEGRDRIPFHLLRLSDPLLFLARFSSRLTGWLFD